MKGEMRLYERSSGGQWSAQGAAIPVLFGKNGVAWGTGLAGQEQKGLRKVERDGRAPAGVFPIGKIYTYDAQLPPGAAVWLRATVEFQKLRFSWSLDGERWTQHDSPAPCGLRSLAYLQLADTQPLHVEIVDGQPPHARPADREASDRDASYRQRADGESAYRKCTQRGSANGQRARSPGLGDAPATRLSLDLPDRTSLDTRSFSRLGDSFLIPEPVATCAPGTCRGTITRFRWNLP